MQQSPSRDGISASEQAEQSLNNIITDQKDNNIKSPKQESNESPYQPSPINIWLQGCLLFLFFLMIYFLIGGLLWKYVSPYWKWSIYLSPIFFCQLFVVACLAIFILDSYDGSDIKAKDEATYKQEECFCSLTVVLPIILGVWPIFTIIYMGVYDNIISISPTLIERGIYNESGNITAQFSLDFQQEKYTIYMIQLPSIGEQPQFGYSCTSDRYEEGVLSFNPPAYLSYQLKQDVLPEIEQIYKLPSWLCTDKIQTKNSMITQDLYSGQIREDPLLITKNSTVYKLVLFRDPIYIPEVSFALFVGFEYIQLWWFTSILIYTTLILYDTSVLQTYFETEYKVRLAQQAFEFNYEQNHNQNQKNNNQIQMPSRMRRGILILFGFLQSNCLLTLAITLSVRENVFRIILLLLIAIPGILVLLVSFFSKTHQPFIQFYSSFFKVSTASIKDGRESEQAHERICFTIYAIIFPFLIFIFLLIYILICLYGCLYVLNIKMYLARHFVCLWKGIDHHDLSEIEYNKFVNRIFYLDWFWRGLFISICLTIYAQNNHPRTFVFWITFILTLQELLTPIFIFCFSKNKLKFTDLPNPLFYRRQATLYVKVQQLEAVNIQEDFKMDDPNNLQ